MDNHSTAKKIGTSGAITIPRQMRAKAGMFPGNAVNITCDADGTVTLKTVVPCCSFCGSPEDVFSVSDTRICQKCAEIIKEKVSEKHGGS